MPRLGRFEGQVHGACAVRAGPRALYGGAYPAPPSGDGCHGPGGVPRPDSSGHRRQDTFRIPAPPGEWLRSSGHPRDRDYGAGGRGGGSYVAGTQGGDGVPYPSRWSAGDGSRPSPREPEVHPHLSSTWSQGHPPPQAPSGRYGAGGASRGTGALDAQPSLRNLVLLAGSAEDVRPAYNPEKRDDEDEDDDDDDGFNDWADPTRSTDRTRR